MGEDEKLSMTEILQPYELEHRVRAFETGYTGKLTPSALIHLLQHCAGSHADELGWSIHALHEAGQTWVLQRFYLEINRLPVIDEKFTIKTRPSGADRILAFRDYKVFDENDNTLALATSNWVVLDLKTRRPVFITDDVKELGNRFGSRWLEMPANKLLTVKSPEITKEFHVRKHDLDLNRHVNNVRYIEWALEAVPDSIFESRPLASLDIIFKSECLYEDEITSAAEQSESGRFKHTLIRKSDEKAVAIMESRFKD